MKKILAIFTFAAIIAASVLGGCSGDNKDKKSSLPEKAATTDEPATESKVSTTGNKIHINDSTLGQIWITELEGVPVNKLDPKGFTADNNFKYYSENGKAASLEGVDISSYSGDIDWEKVKDSGIDFVMVRLGGRGYGEKGEIYKDDRALEYIKGAQAQGIKAGGYFFSQATTTNEAIEEADYVKEILGDTKLDFPVAYDWEKVKDSGIDFVMVRLGGRGYGEKGEIYKDDRALEYIKGAQAQGIKAGGYFFSQATTTNEAIEEADYVKEILGDTKLDFPVAYDWEIIKDEEARTDKVTPAQATECARAFCQEAASYGYTPMIYSTSRELYFKYDLTKLANYDIWYCEYANTPEFYYQFSMWQYSETGKVDGIEGNVDLNICFTGVAKYAE